MDRNFAQSKPWETMGRRATKLNKTEIISAHIVRIMFRKKVFLFYMLVEPPKDL